MTTEEKARAYDEALERARIWQNHLYDTNDRDYADELNYIFPDLKEQEDERIRKELIGFLRNIPNSNYTCEEMALWLEKQGQVKESEIPQPIKETSKENDNSLTNKAWSEEDEKMLDGIVNTVKDVRCQSLLSEIEIYDDYIDWLESIKQRIGG